MTNYISETEFDQLVKKYYQFLMDDFGFVMEKIADWSFRLKTQNTMVTIFAEHGILLTVALQPIGQEADQLQKKHIPSRKIDAIVLSMCLNPDLRYRIARIDKNPISCDIPLELERRALLLKKYCGKMLGGDFSDWIEIRKRIAERQRDLLSL